MLCKKCGNNVKSDFKYCPYCGERIVSDFHDHYEELTPPFLVREPDEPDAAALARGIQGARAGGDHGQGGAQGQGAPDFALPPTAAPEEPPLAPGAFPQEDLEDDLAPPHFRVSLPEEPAPGGYGGPLFGANGPPASGRYAAPAGFEPVDVLQGIAMIMRQLHEGRAEIEIAYSRGVMREGNPVALAAIDEVFDTVDATWRGLGVIPGSGYAIREEFEDFDAVKRFHPEVEPTQNPKGCRCGDVLRGIMAPDECPLFRKVCMPENPVGPCMVSSEGSCAAYYRYY